MSNDRQPIVLEGEGEEVVQPKLTVDYEGYERTITDVIRIKEAASQDENENEESNAVMCDLLRNIDGAVKECRVLRTRLERFRKKRTGHFPQIPKK